MLKKIALTLLVLLLLAAGYVAVTFVIPVQNAAAQFGIEATTKDFKIQDNSRVNIPEPQTSRTQSKLNNKQLYWGELHLHTKESFDSSLFGNTFGIEDAYKFAKGQQLTLESGETMQLTRPLDFVAITDHAEGFGTVTHCQDPDLGVLEKFSCWLATMPNPAIYQFIVGAARGEEVLGDPSKPAGVYQRTQREKLNQSFPLSCRFGNIASERCFQNTYNDWARYVQLANKYNEPGVLTTLIAYEFSPALPNRGKHHRNIIFRSGNVPDRAISSFDVSNAIDLWTGLEESCLADCQFLTIPHNLNKTWGLIYSRYTWDGGEFNEAGWSLRNKYEPLAEMYQIKGASECALGVGATDEECAFEQIFDPCIAGATTNCAFQTSFARQGLKIGLELNEELGFNPLKFGFVAASDSHNSNPGDVEEWDFVGSAANVMSSSIRRIKPDPANTDPLNSTIKSNSSGGLAAVWAEENTRESIFDALARRETYATSGPRMVVRFLASFNDNEPLSEKSFIDGNNASIVPMGSVLNATNNQQSPTFFVWASKDLLDAPLQSIQIIKGWIDETGQTHESVTDIICSDGLTVDPESGRCPNNQATVNLETCEYSKESGANELKTLWQDPNYLPNQNAFYYARVLMNPTCRWSTYDAIRLGRTPDPRVPATVQERAWTSPIWIEHNK